MPKQKIAREDILRAAAEVVRKEGEEALNARRLAAELNCSTQPVYSQFVGMAELVQALRGRAVEEYRRRIDDYLSACAPRDRYEAYGMGYVRFAREEKGLFRMLNSKNSAPLQVEEPFLADIIGEMKSIYGMDEARARAFHADMALYSYGLAMQVNTSALPFSDEEIAERLEVEFCALYRYYFPERPPIEKREHVIERKKPPAQP